MNNGEGLLVVVTALGTAAPVDDTALNMSGVLLRCGGWDCLALEDAGFNCWALGLPQRPAYFRGTIVLGSFGDRMQARALSFPAATDSFFGVGDRVSSSVGKEGGPSAMVKH